MNKNPNPSTRKRLTGGVLAVILLALCLVVTTYALVYYSVEVKDNYFNTGKVDIAIYGEAKNGLIIDKEQFLFEPGMKVVKPFHIRNYTQWSSYCRLYFEKVDGDLADVLQITIKDAGENVLYTGTMTSLSNRTKADSFVLSAYSVSDYTMEFYFPTTAGNEVQDKTLTFTLSADATQMKNNPNREF